MSNTEEIKPSKRAEEVRQQRRRRADLDDESNAPLAVNHKFLDHDNYAYRFINDTPGRLQKMYDEDWDKVEDPRVMAQANSEGAAIRRLVGANKDGTPLYSYLHRKPKKMYDEDRGRKMAKVNETEEALKRGMTGNTGALSADSPGAYIPGGKKEVVSISSSKKSGQYEP